MIAGPSACQRRDSCANVRFRGPRAAATGRERTSTLGRVRWWFLAFPHYGLRWLVAAQSDERGMTDLSFRSPLGELDFRNESRIHPSLAIRAPVEVHRQAQITSSWSAVFAVRQTRLILADSCLSPGRTLGWGFVLRGWSPMPFSGSLDPLAQRQSPNHSPTPGVPGPPQPLDPSE